MRKINMPCNHNRKRYFQVGLLVVAAILVIIVTSLLRFYIFEKFNKSKQELKQGSQPKTTLEQCYQIAKQQISNREILKQEKTNSILIGRQLKELENGYFDIKWEQKENTVLWMNLLCKENVTTQHRYEETYVEEIIAWIQQVKRISLSSAEREELMKKIITAYITIRDPSTVQAVVTKPNKEIYTDQVSFPMVTISIQIQNYMVMLEIKKR